MRQNLLTHWGTPQERVLNAVSSLQRGGGVLVVDDDDRENEGDLIFSADSLTNEQMATLIRECSGIVCLCITRDKARSLDLPQMVPKNTSSYGTAFTVSIEAAEGVTTGVSAAERRAFPLWGLMRVDKPGPGPCPACPKCTVTHLQLTEW